MSVRVAGMLVRQTLNWDGANNRMVFKIRAAGEKVVLPVSYQGIAPESLVDDSQVIVEGAMDGSTFNAQTLLVKCPDNYLTEQAIGAVFKTLKIEGSLYR